MSCGCQDVVADRHDRGLESRGLIQPRLAPIVFMNRHISRFFKYTWGMRKTLDGYLDEQLGRGRGYLTKGEAMKTLARPFSDRVRRYRSTPGPAPSTRESETGFLPHPAAGRPGRRRS